MSTIFYAISKQDLIESNFYNSEDSSEILSNQGSLIGQSSYGSRFLFGPNFPDGLISMSHLIEKIHQSL